MDMFRRHQNSQNSGFGAGCGIFDAESQAWCQNNVHLDEHNQAHVRMEAKTVEV